MTALRLPVFLSVMLLPVAVAAQGVCVTCVGPDRNYRCTIKDADKLQQFRGSQRAQEFVCLSELARAGGHQSCRLSTGFQGPCIGQPHEIDMAQIGKELGHEISRNVTQEPSNDTASPSTKAAGEPGNKSPVVPERKGPPETLEQLARETFQKSKEQISAADEGMKKAGVAVGGAAQKTWNCVVSLFQKC